MIEDFTWPELRSDSVSCGSLGLWRELWWACKPSWALFPFALLKKLVFFSRAKGKNSGVFYVRLPFCSAEETCFLQQSERETCEKVVKWLSKGCQRAVVSVKGLSDGCQRAFKGLSRLSEVCQRVVKGLSNGCQTAVQGMSKACQGCRRGCQSCQRAVKGLARLSEGF